MTKLTTFLSNLVLLVLLSHFPSPSTAQPASAPGPAGPPNITAILTKAGQFTTFLRLMKSTQVADQINNQLNNSNSGITVFAPTDNAFTSLASGTLNTLSDQQKVSLIQFHVLPTYVSMSQFETISNPLRTQAGNSDNGQYPLNVSAAGQQVNISTGVVNATVDNSIFSDGQLAVYQVNQVLLPLDLFGAKSPAPAPAPAEAKDKKKKPAAGAPSTEPADTDTTTSDSTSAAGLRLDREAMNAAILGIFLGFYLVGSLI